MTSSAPRTDRPRSGAVVALALGALAVVGATVVGSNEGLPRHARHAAAAPAGVPGRRFGGARVRAARSVGRRGSPRPASDDVPALIRAVRLAFLAVAAFAAAAGWALGHPLPLIVAAVIAGIDVIETSFLLLVVGRR